MSADKEPTITLPLRTFLTILWGFKYQGELRDYRERAYPGEEVINALEQQIPPEIAARFFKIVRPQPSVDAVVWHVDEWKRSGQREVEFKEAQDTFNKRADALTAWLLKKVPILAANGKDFVRNLAFVVVKDGNYTSLQCFGLTSEQIELIKRGDIN
jgi:hypothetical protein